MIPVEAAPEGPGLREAELVMRELNLPMLMVDLGVVDGMSPVPAQRIWRARLTTARRPVAAELAAVVARLLAVGSVRSASVDRTERWGRLTVTVQAVVALDAGDWRLVLDVVHV